jgi:hypothetical protein
VIFLSEFEATRSYDLLISLPIRSGNAHWTDTVVVVEKGAPLAANVPIKVNARVPALTVKIKEADAQRDSDRHCFIGRPQEGLLRE